MTDYNEILATETDPDAPLRSSLFKRMVANPIAMGEGALGAPRLHYSAMERIYAGDEVRLSRPTASLVTTATFTLVPNTTWAFQQAGTIRIRFSHWRNANTSEVRVRQTRGGVTTTLTTLSSTAGSAPGTAQSYDADIQPGDIVFLEQRNTGGVNSTTQDVTLGLLNATDILVPYGSDMFGSMLNPSIPTP
jgi:hypothetical protein